MIKRLEDNGTILLFSHNAKCLANFYKSKVGLPMTFRGRVTGDKEIYLFEMNDGGIIYISDLADKLTENDIQQNILNFEVEDIEIETRRLQDMGVKKINDVNFIQELGYVAVFQDLEGNYIQLIQPVISFYAQASGKNGLIN